MSKLFEDGAIKSKGLIMMPLFWLLNIDFEFNCDKIQTVMFPKIPTPNSNNGSDECV